MTPHTSIHKFEPFTYKSLSDLQETIKRLGLKIPISAEVDILKQSIKIGKKFVPNRLAVQPMEGYDAKTNGAPGELTFRRYKRYAKGGSGLIWFEATSISDEGCSNINQIAMTYETLKDFKDLVSVTREMSTNTLKRLGLNGSSLLIIQLNHSGRVTKKDGKQFPIKAYNNSYLDGKMKVSEYDGKIISDEELADLEDIWVNKAILAKEAGFDGVDIKACHGYLIGELLTARNRINSKYGGDSLKNRTRFFFNIIEKLKKEIGNDPNFLITTRFGPYDGIPYPNGFGVSENEGKTFPAPVNLNEPLKVMKKLYDLGIRLINISAGNPYYGAYITRPYDTPVKGGNIQPENPLCGVERIMKITSDIKKQIPKDMIIMGSCYSYLREYAGNVAAGVIKEKMVDICGFGRMAFANPDFPRQIFQEGSINKKMTCIACSKCSGFMKLGMNAGCAIRDPQYK